MEPGTPSTSLRRAPPLAGDERRVVDPGLAIAHRFHEDVVPPVVAEGRRHRGALDATLDERLPDPLRRVTLLKGPAIPTLCTMDATSLRWQAITESEFPWERDALAFVRDRLPDHDPYRVWSNFEFIADDGVDQRGRPARADAEGFLPGRDQEPPGNRGRRSRNVDLAARGR